MTRHPTVENSEHGNIHPYSRLSRRVPCQPIAHAHGLEFPRSRCLLIVRRPYNLVAVMTHA
jgi:hypothetical protein